MRYLFTVIIAFFLLSCGEEQQEITAGKVVDNAIANAGGEKYKKAEIEFIFRKHQYKSTRNGGEFKLERITSDTTGKITHDILDNEGLRRYVNDSATTLPDSLVAPIGNSINSVHYFVQLPFGLNAEAANKKLIGKDSIAGKEYYEVMVTFSEDGGGTDHEDEYMYWIDTKDFQVDYLAYNFVVNKGGIRFRKAFNPRRVEGIRFVDYENYKYSNLDTPLHKLDSLFQKGELEYLSTIRTEDVKVKIND
ncbi:DUF6503 family protein [Christiangramia salexigens]|uniref:Deoxyribose-phosphate aldolase n=1 Tax=Christiangramia salexigens TaxID=1913577 RepID=A0A1L3J4B3_9FLAO|nr:DUF6503 family protein [Christiangramia salexigens]APG59977.1 deoxyribose-phosphate aldolase [Christiangramia salexigens]